jgi:hypothetical protein
VREVGLVESLLLDDLLEKKGRRFRKKGRKRVRECDEER